MNKVEEFEKEVKKKFVEEPGQMKLLIVVDKLLTGFDAPPATYLYIDKQMRDHGLFQAICRVNRLDGDDKEYGYIIDYKDLFKSLEGAVKDYTSRRARRLRQGGRRGAAGGPAGEGPGATWRKRARRSRRSASRSQPPRDYGGVPALLLRARSRATPSSSRTTSRSGWRSTSSRRGLAARLRQPRQRDGGGRLHARPRSQQIKARGRPLREGARRGEAGQRRLHRPQDVRAGHAPPDRHLHPGRGEREGLRLRRPDR